MAAVDTLEQLRSQITKTEAKLKTTLNVLQSARTELDDTFTTIGHGAFASYIQISFPELYSNLIPRDQEDFEDTPYELIADGDNDSVSMLCKLSGMLVMGALSVAVGYAEQCNGGGGSGGSNDFPRKKDDEEDEAWRQRCLYAAYDILRPAFRRRRGLRR